MNKIFSRKKRRIIIDAIISIVVVGTLAWMYIDFDRFLKPDFMPTGKAAKLMIVITNLLYKIGGKLFTISVFSILAIPFVYRSIKGLLNSNNRLYQEEKQIFLSVNDKFRHENYEVHVKEITSTEKGFSGKGWVEMGIVNKVKKPVEFNNLELNEDFISIKGDLRFLDDE